MAARTNKLGHSAGGMNTVAAPASGTIGNKIKFILVPAFFLLTGTVWTQHTNAVKTEIRNQSLEARITLLTDEKEKWKTQHDQLAQKLKDLENAYAGLLSTMRELGEKVKGLTSQDVPQASPEARKLGGEIQQLIQKNEALEDKPAGGRPEDAVLAKEGRAEFTEVVEQSELAEPRGDVMGRITGLEHPERYKVVIYTQTDHWYAQPLAADYITDISEDGTWRSWVHLGKQYAVILIDPSYRPPVVSDVLPVVGGPVLAKAVKSAPGDGTR